MVAASTVCSTGKGHDEGLDSLVCNSAILPRPTSPGGRAGKAMTGQCLTQLCFYSVPPLYIVAFLSSPLCSFSFYAKILAIAKTKTKQHTRTQLNPQFKEPTLGRL